MHSVNSRHNDLLFIHPAFTSCSRIAEYVSIHKQRPDDPFPVFCICVALVHLASQKFTSSKNSIVVQVISVSRVSVIVL